MKIAANLSLKFLKIENLSHIGRLAIFTIGCLSWEFNKSAIAQIVPDRTLPENSVVVDGDRLQTINSGTTAGKNLFHSFQEFSVNTGNVAWFNNATDIQNIITRVTGNNISTLDGILRTNGNANLFLLNPNGIVFGKNAQLAIAGSFIASTAENIKFTDGSIFSASNPSNSSLLTVNIPIGLQLGKNPGAIEVKGDGLNYTENFPTNNFGLTTAPGKTLALLGGDVYFSGGIATNLGGRLEVGSAVDSEVSLKPSLDGWHLGYDYATAQPTDRAKNFGNINLSDRATLWSPSSSPLPDAGIYLKGRNISLNSSQIASLTSDSQPAGKINIDATESFSMGGIDLGAIEVLKTLDLTQIDPNNLFLGSQLLSLVNQKSSGNGGNIQIKTPQLIVKDGARIQTVSLGEGNAGNIKIDSNSLAIEGYFPIPYRGNDQTKSANSRIVSVNNDRGRGGNISIFTSKLFAIDGGQIVTLSSENSSGKSGKIDINATKEILATGTNLLVPDSPSSIANLVFGAGDGQDVNITTDRLQVLYGALIGSETKGTGKGGNLKIQANKIIGFGASLVTPFQAGQGMMTLTSSSGDSGNIDISTKTLKLADGVEISSHVLYDTQTGSQIKPATGNAGKVTVNASESIELQGYHPQYPDLPTFIGSNTFGNGKAGDVRVSTQVLKIKDGAGIISGVVTNVPSASLTDSEAKLGNGRGANINVKATDINIIGINPTTVFPSSISAYTFGNGDAGNLKISTSQLHIQDGGQVSSSTLGRGNAGQLTIDANDILVSDLNSKAIPSQISSSALILSPTFQKIYFLPPFPTGNTGEITINADRLSIENGGTVNVKHQGTGNAGKLNLRVNSIFLNNGGEIAASTASGKGGNINLQVGNLLLLKDSSQITSTAGGNSNGGNINIHSPLIAAINNSDIIANAFEGKGGNIQITTQGMFGLQFRPQLTNASDITASSQFGINGAVNIEQLDLQPNTELLELPNETIAPDQKIATGCRNNRDNYFKAIGKGGTPEDPINNVKGQTIWQDLRLVDRYNNDKDKTIDTASNSKSNNLPTPIEAQSWQINARGNIQLLTTKSSGLEVDRFNCREQLTTNH
jgi:filamentous hemagglutinin family protein